MQKSGEKFAYVADFSYLCSIKEKKLIIENWAAREADLTFDI